MKRKWYHGVAMFINKMRRRGHMREDRYYLALHEAAHALVAEILYERSVVWIDMMECAGYNAKVVLQWSVDSSYTKKVAVHLAGMVACEMHGYRFAGRGCGDDLEKVYKILDEVTMSDEEAKKMLTTIYGSTRILLSVNKRRLLRLAKVLMTCMWMDGEYVREIIGRGKRNPPV